MSEKVVVNELSETDGEFQGKLEDGVRFYVVGDIAAFFEIYRGFDDTERDAIEQRWRDQDLLVFKDGSAYWEDGEPLLESLDDDPIDDEAFNGEAAFSGAVVDG